MSSKRRLLIVLLLYIVLVAVAESLPHFAESLNLKEDIAREIAALTPLLLTTIVVSAIFHFSHEQAEAVITFMSSLGVQSRVRILPSADTYRTLRESALTASHRLYTSYFGGQPPTGKPEEKRLYQRTIASLHKKRPNVQVKRIVLLTRENLPWIQRLAAAMAGAENASLAVYCPSDGHGLPLSLQLVDQRRAILVNPTEKPAGALRDIMILDSQAVELLDGYYSRIWSASRQVVLKGNLRQAEMARLTELASPDKGLDDDE